MNLEQYQNDGYYLLEKALSSAQVAKLITETEPLLAGEKSYGVRNLFNLIPGVETLAKSGLLKTLAGDILGSGALPVRAIFFDKIPGANWNVAWHQDTTIAVAEKHELIGYGSWSEKAGVIHGEPPLNILENMVTLRVHLDTTGVDNGALRLIPGTHNKGRLGSSEILSLVEGAMVVDCEAEPGDILIMSPLLLHSSRKSRTPAHRRIIHIEYCGQQLAPPLEWHENSEQSGVG